MTTEADVRRICRGLPGVVERPSWGQPAWFAKTLMARIWEPGVLTVKTTEREALAGTNPRTYFWTPHHERSPQLVLVRMDHIDVKELGELLEDSFLLAGGARSREVDQRWYASRRLSIEGRRFNRELDHCQLPLDADSVCAPRPG